VFSFDWRTLFIPSDSLLELFVRGTLLYFFIFAAMRVLRRQGGSVGTADLIVVVLVADAAQNGMAGTYTSISDAMLVVGTIVAWNHFLDWLAYHFPLLQRLLEPRALLVVENGRILWRNMRVELISRQELEAKLREHDVRDIKEVQKAFVEPNGEISVLKKR
jgi:uncharacterized membrane protein YcaP (DUF421 family)